LGEVDFDILLFFGQSGPNLIAKGLKIGRGQFFEASDGQSVSSR
jgi:hypothetical protein